jgi:predicted nucleic acid-binding protein
LVFKLIFHTDWYVVKHFYQKNEARAAQGKLQGGQFHDARIAVICLENGASVIHTADRDFGRFKASKTFNSLID